jgi:hypothetical protein
MSSQEEIPDEGTRQGDFVCDGILLSPYLAVKPDNGIGLENLRVSASSATPIARRVLTSRFQLAVQLSETAPAVCL